MAQLKLCPFCGNKAHLHHDSGYEVFPQTWWVQCIQCWCKTGRFAGSNVYDPNRNTQLDAQAEQQAIYAWNTRYHA